MRSYQSTFWLFLVLFLLGVIVFIASRGQYKHSFTYFCTFHLRRDVSVCGDGHQWTISAEMCFTVHNILFWGFFFIPVSFPESVFLSVFLSSHSWSGHEITLCCVHRQEKPHWQRNTSNFRPLLGFDLTSDYLCCSGCDSSVETIKFNLHFDVKVIYWTWERWRVWAYRHLMVV